MYYLSAVVAVWAALVFFVHRAARSTVTAQDHDYEPSSTSNRVCRPVATATDGVDDDDKNDDDVVLVYPLAGSNLLNGATAVNRGGDTRLLNVDGRTFVETPGASRCGDFGLAAFLRLPPPTPSLVRRTPESNATPPTKGSSSGGGDPAPPPTRRRLRPATTRQEKEEEEEAVYVCLPTTVVDVMNAAVADGRPRDGWPVSVAVRPVTGRYLVDSIDALSAEGYFATYRRPARSRPRSVASREPTTRRVYEV